MTDQYLMELDNATMNVKPDKLAEYLTAGWKVLKTPDENKTVVVQDQPVVELPPVAIETTSPTTDPSPNASHSERGEAVSVDEAVEKIGKRSRSKNSKKG